MKRKNLKKAGAFLLAAAMLLTGIPKFSTEARATGAELPDSSQFATIEQLKAFNTNDNDGEVNPAKVKFGQNGSGSAQEWWIVGSQNNNSIVLFSASSLTNSFFSYNTNNKTYNDNGTDREVYANHYALSDVRSALQNLVTNTAYFSSAEQDLMQETTVWTRDERNKTNYSTTDILYAVYGGNDGEKYIIAGANSSSSLNGGLRIDEEYWIDSLFWLRNAITNSLWARSAEKGNGVDAHNIGYKRSVSAAFQLDVSEVIFGSGAEAAVSSGKLNTSDAFTLRYSTDQLGSAVVSYDKKKVDLTGVPAGTYLVAQNSEDAWAKEITNESSISADDMGIDSFINCKVWLETTDSTDRITYATMATEELGYFVDIEKNTGLAIVSDNGNQVVRAGNAITDITVEAEEGYHLPQGYENTISGLNGLSVTRTSTGFQISGTPTADVEITLEKANAIPVITASDKTLTYGDTFEALDDVTANDDEDGDITEDIKVISDNVDTTTVGNYSVTYKITDSQGASSTKTITVEVEKADSEIFFKNTDKTYTGNSVIWIKDTDYTVTGSTGKVSFSYQELVNDMWTDMASEPINAGTYRVQAEVETDKNYNEAVSGYVDFTIGKVLPQYTIPDDLTAKYGQHLSDITLPEGFSWEDETQSVGKVGENTFKAVYTPEDTDNYEVVKDIDINVTVSQATNNWDEELSITDWTYGGYDADMNAPYASAEFGTVTYTYSDEKDGEYTSEVPATAGIWYVKAVVEETEDYAGLESEAVSFEILPEDSSKLTIPDISENTDLDKLEIKDGDNILIQGRDYEVTKEQEGNVVTVTITFKGNYAGIVTRTYEVTDTGSSDDTPKTGDNETDENGADNNKTDENGADNSKTDENGTSGADTTGNTVETGGNSPSAGNTPLAGDNASTDRDKASSADSKTPSTGDNINMSLWISLLVLSGGVAAVIIGKKYKKKYENE